MDLGGKVILQWKKSGFFASLISHFITSNIYFLIDFMNTGDHHLRVGGYLATEIDNILSLDEWLELQECSDEDYFHVLIKKDLMSSIICYTVHGQGQGRARILVVWPGPHGVKGQGRCLGPTWPDPVSIHPTLIPKFTHQISNLELA